MLDFNSSIVLKLFSSLLFLLSGVLWKQLLLTDRKNYHFIFFRVISTLFFLVAIFLFLAIFEINFFEQIIISTISLMDWIICLSICFFSFFGLYFYTNAMQSGRYTVVTPLIVLSTAFSFVTSLILYNETLSTTKYVALGLLVTGLFLHQKEKLRRFQFSKEIALVLLCSFFWGISFVLYLIPISKFGVLNFSIILEVCVLISCIGLLFFKEKKVFPSKLNKMNLLLCTLMGLLIAVGSLLSNLTLTQLPVSLNILIGLLFEIIVLGIGIFLFREKLHRNDWYLIVFATVGSFLLLM